MIENPGPMLYTVAQAARLLQVSKNHMYSLIEQGVVRHVRFGKLIRIPQWSLIQDIAAASGAPLPFDDSVAFRPTQSVHVVHQDEEGDDG